MSEKKKEMTKPKKVSVPPFVEREDAEQTATKATPSIPETNPEEYPLFKKLEELKDAIKDLKETLEEKEKGIVHQLCRIADDLDEILGKQVLKFVQTPSQSPPVPQPTPRTTAPKPAPTPFPEPAGTTGKQVEDIRMLFTKELEELLVFEDKGDYIRVAPRQFLGSDNFAKIASVIREASGEYISDKRNSHFRIPK